MNMRRVLGCALSLAALALTACGGASAVIKGACLSVAPPALLYPAPSSSALPDGNLDIWVGYAANPATVFSAPVLSSPSAATVTGSAWAAPSPGPTNPPGIASLPNGDSYWTSGILALSPQTTYTVNVTNTLCNQTFSLGSFTTQ